MMILDDDSAVQLMAICVMLKDSELAIIGQFSTEATKVLTDIGEELVLQIAGYPDGKS